MQKKRFLIPALAALGLFFLALSGLGLSSANAAGLSPMSAVHDQTAMSGKSSVTKIQWGWRGGWGPGWGGAAQAGTAADGVGAKAGACPLASDMDLDTPVGATEAGVMAVVAVAAAGKLLTW